MQASKTINAVFEGGGVKGIGLAGAIAATESLGYKFGNVAGTSAGAIVAALLASGYTAAEIETELKAIDYQKFRDASGFAKLPVIGPALQLLVHKGIYDGLYFEQWLRTLLKRKGIRTFGDLVNVTEPLGSRYRYRLQIIASDITRGKLLVLPRDAADYDIDPNTLDVALAVRMSMSIPYFYIPVRYTGVSGQEFYVVDGGILSNFPVWILDDPEDPLAFPTIGYKLVEPEEGRPHRVRGPISFFSAMFSTMTEAHDARYIKDANFMRTVPIETLEVHTTDFGISEEQKAALYQRGYAAATKFFSTWKLTDYQTACERIQSQTRTERLRTESRS